MLSPVIDGINVSIALERDVELCFKLPHQTDLQNEIALDLASRSDKIRLGNHGLSRSAGLTTIINGMIHAVKGLDSVGVHLSIDRKRRKLCLQDSERLDATHVLLEIAPLAGRHAYFNVLGQMVKMDDVKGLPPRVRMRNVGTVVHALRTIAGITSNRGVSWMQSKRYRRGDAFHTSIFHSLDPCATTAIEWIVESMNPETKVHAIRVVDPGRPARFIGHGEAGFTKAFALVAGA